MLKCKNSCRHATAKTFVNLNVQEAIADQRLKTLSEEIKSVYETHEFKPISSDTFTSTTLALQVYISKHL